MPYSYPNFYIEPSETVILPAPVGAALWTEPLWSNTNVYPMMRGSWNQLGNQSWCLTPSGLASGMVNIYNYWNSGYVNNLGRTLDKFALSVAAMGHGRYTSNLNSSGNYLFNHPQDMSPGVTGANTTDSNYFDYLVPWSVTGIHVFKQWASGFFPELRKRWDLNSLPNPTAWLINSENTSDLSRAVVPEGTGWVDRLKPKAAYTNVLFDGTQTFAQYIASTTGWYDGTLIPTGLNVDLTYWQYGPQNAKMHHLYAAAYHRGHMYATVKGIVEPIYAMFASGLDIAEYQRHGDSLTYHVPDYYPGQDICLDGTCPLPSQSFEFYGEAYKTNDNEEDGIPPYWPSTTGWVNTYPRPNGYTEYSAYDYATLRWAQDRAYNVKTFSPNQKVYVWVRAVNDTKIPIMIDFIKYCYQIGIVDFVIFDSNIVAGSPGGGHTRWNTIVSAVNSYIDTLNISTVGHSVATVARFADGYFKI
jgi:hypothetical protein